MGRTRSIPKAPASVTRAWREGGELAVTRAAVQKYAEVIDATESGRDMKPLITGMFEAIDRLKALELAEDERRGETPLFAIMAKADEMEAAHG